MTRRAVLYSLVLVATVALQLALGCGYAKRIDPPLYTYDTPRVTLLSAQAHARDVGGIVTMPLPDTRSMEPLLHVGDILVIAPPTVSPYGSRLKGRVIHYRAAWNTKVTPVHRVTAEDKDGLLVEGDNVDAGHPENKWRVTEANYLGEVVGIYRTKKD